MTIDITNIVNTKIENLETTGAIRDQIEKSIEKTILGAISNALESYDLKRDIEKQVTESVSGVVKEIGFSGYNGFIADKIRTITQETMREDVAQKIQKTFDDLFVKKVESIKLSEIFDRYRNWVREDVEESDQYARRNFTCSLDVEENGNFTHYSVKFHDQAVDRYEKPQIEFRACIYGKDTEASISSLYLEGEKAESRFRLGRLTDVEALLANLYFNETKIEMDVDQVNEDDYFEIDS